MVGQRQAEDGDVVEVVADFADHLADPGVAVVAIVAEQLGERAHREALTAISGQEVTHSS